MSETNKERAALVVDADLIAAAECGTIAGAVLDVFRAEPLPAGQPFWSAKNIVALLHARRRASAAGQIRVRAVRGNARRFADGRPLVDRARGY